MISGCECGRYSCEYCRPHLMLADRIVYEKGKFIVRDEVPTEVCIDPDYSIDYSFDVYWVDPLNE